MITSANLSFHRVPGEQASTTSEKLSDTCAGVAVSPFQRLLGATVVVRVTASTYDRLSPSLLLWDDEGRQPYRHSPGAHL